MCVLDCVCVLCMVYSFRNTRQLWYPVVIVKVLFFVVIKPRQLVDTPFVTSFLWKMHAVTCLAFTRWVRVIVYLPSPKSFRLQNCRSSVLWRKVTPSRRYLYRDRSRYNMNSDFLFHKTAFCCRYIFPGLALGAALGQTGRVTNHMINR